MSCFIAGLITAAVIVFSRHCSINPDNVATPIAASLGDITSLALLSWISTVLYDAIGKFRESVLIYWWESYFSVIITA
jgi:solute carrier family 41